MPLQCCSRHGAGGVIRCPHHTHSDVGRGRSGCAWWWAWRSLVPSRSSTNFLAVFAIPAIRVVGASPRRRQVRRVVRSQGRVTKCYRRRPPRRCSRSASTATAASTASADESTRSKQITGARASFLLRRACITYWNRTIWYQCVLAALGLCLQLL